MAILKYSKSQRQWKGWAEGAAVQGPAPPREFIMLVLLILVILQLHKYFFRSYINKQILYTHMDIKFKIGTC